MRIGGNLPVNWLKRTTLFFLDSGTTLQHMAVALAQRIKEAPVKDIAMVDLQIHLRTLKNPDVKL